jgi:hypothetical protein
MLYLRLGLLWFRSNRPDDPEYILRLIGQVITVSLETVKLVTQLTTLSIDQT